MSSLPRPNPDPPGPTEPPERPDHPDRPERRRLPAPRMWVWPLLTVLVSLVCFLALVAG